MAQQAGRTPPKYQQVADDLRAKIEAGEYPVDGLLPTKPELMKRYGASLGTIDHAIAELRKPGLVETVQGVGMFARRPPEPEPSVERMDALESEVTALRERLGAAEQELAFLQTQVVNLYRSTGQPSVTVHADDARSLDWGANRNDATAPGALRQRNTPGPAQAERA
ncbi:MAG: GntR family transcriptional regulator [Streptosporangiaceae bacterium]